MTAQVLLFNGPKCELVDVPDNAIKAWEFLDEFRKFRVQFEGDVNVTFTHKDGLACTVNLNRCSYETLTKCIDAYKHSIVEVVGCNDNYLKNLQKAYNLLLAAYQLGVGDGESAGVEDDGYSLLTKSQLNKDTRSFETRVHELMDSIHDDGIGEGRYG